MSELISGKEAKLAWANGENVEFYSEDLDKWFSLNDDVFLSDVFDARKLRLKPRTIALNGIEVPAPFDPKYGDEVYFIDCETTKGYSGDAIGEGCKERWIQFGAWRTEEEIKQVVAALRSVFKGGV